MKGKQYHQCPCSRRTALKVGAGIAGSLALGIGSTGCGGTVLDSPLTLNRVDYPTIEEIGGITRIPASETGVGYAIFIYRRGDTDFVAFTAECPHAGCEVGKAGNNFRCPCHGATFDIEGHVTGGPTNQDLPPVKVDVTATTITLSS